MKIKISIKKESAAAKVMEALKAEKEAFKSLVQSGKATNNTRKPKKVAPTSLYN